MHYSIKQALDIGRNQLRDAAIDNPALDARILLEHTLKLSHEELLLKQEHTISFAEFKDFSTLIERRKKSEPIAYLIHTKEFYGLEFYIDENVLIPRPDSETLIEEALKYFGPKSNIKILDLGVGSGCLLLTLLHHFKNASGVAVDISKKALEVTKHNYKKLKLKNPIEFLDRDWNNLKLDSKFDLIISNPPYIKNNDIQDLQKDVKNYEPLTALKGGGDGLDCYKKLIPIIKNLLNPKAVAIIECGEGQHKQIAEISKEHGLDVKKYSRDLSEIVRCVTIAINAKLS